MAKVILCNLQNNGKLINLLTIMGIEIVHVGNEDLTIKEILESEDASEKLKIKESAMIMHGFSETQMDGLLKLIRTNGIVIDYKAVTTPFNQQWKFADLMKELRKERLIMNSRK